tara:strand:- start:196 stop:855 length:660 start_codon:yes stop_codon:yes gene_type:complete
LEGFPLIAYSIAIAKILGINRVIVSTDSEKYAEVSVKFGAEVPFMRPKEIASDNATDYEWALHAMEWFKNNENFLPEYWFHLRPTTPLRKPKILIEAFNTIVNDENATSLRSAHLVPESPFKWFMKDDNGYFKGLRPDLTSEKVNMPRQYFPKTYNPNGYVDIIRSSYVLNNVDLHGDKMIVYETPVCPEIDTIKDFDYIKYSIQQNRPEILDWLKNHF